MGGIWRLIAPLSFALSSAPVALWRMLRFRPDVVLCIEPTLIAAPVALLAARLVGARAVLHVQDLEVDAAFAVGHLEPRGGLRRSPCASNTQRSRFDTRDHHFRSHGRAAGRQGRRRERIAVVRNWVDLEAFQLGRSRVRAPTRRELGMTATISSRSIRATSAPSRASTN